MARKKDAKGGLVSKDQEDLELQRALRHPVVQHMADKLDQMRSMVEQLPEAIGRAVATSMTQAAAQQPPAGASGPPVPLRLPKQNQPVEFRPGGLVKVGGNEEASTPAGILKLLALVGVWPGLAEVEKWTPEERQQVITWARAQHFSAIGKKGVRVPKRPAFLK